MTIQTEFYNYQDNPKGYDWDKPPFESCSPAVTTMKAYMAERWGLTSLGCHGDRPIVDGTTISTHAFGGAGDDRYESPGPGLFVCDTEIIPWLIATSRETGLQAIHHYRRCMIWRPPGTSGRAWDSDGWKTQRTSSNGMGQTWALWLHTEFLDTRLDDGRSIEEKIAVMPLPTPEPPISAPIIINPTPIPPVLVPGATTMIEVNVTTVRRGSTGNPVKKMQAVLAANFGQTVTIDGAFGAQSEQAVKNVQSFFKLTADGICGPKTWGILLNLPAT